MNRKLTLYKHFDCFYTHPASSLKLQMEFIIQSMGPNKVNVPIKESQTYVQRGERKNDDPFAVFSVFESFPNPFKEFEQLKSSNGSSTYVKTQTNVTTKFCKVPEEKKTTNNTEKNTDDVMNIKSRIAPPKGNTLLCEIMGIMNPLVTVMSGSSLTDTLADFKDDLARNLNNERQLFKEFGFSKKRSLTVDEMKANIRQTTTDGNLRPEVLTYLAYLLLKNICILDSQNLERTETEAIVKSESDSYHVFKLNSGDTFVYLGIKSTDDIDKYAMNMFQEVKECIVPQTMKIQDLRQAYQFLTNKHKTGMKKADLIEFLDQKLKEYKQ